MDFVAPEFWLFRPENKNVDFTIYVIHEQHDRLTEQSVKRKFQASNNTYILPAKEKWKRIKGEIISNSPK
jgi:hypothetical protein